MRLLILAPALALALAFPTGCGSSRTPDVRPADPAESTAPADHRPGGGHHAEGDQHHGRMGMGPGRGPGRMGRMGGGAMNDPDHQTIHALLADHEAIERRVEDLRNGVETWTESDDPEVAARIRQHVRQMAARLDEGRPLRRWDPLFAEIFEHADAIEMVMTDTPRGIHVVETSDDPDVVLLIQQHAHRAVSEFVERGMDRAHEPTPLPEGYDR